MFFNNSITEQIRINIIVSTWQKKKKKKISSKIQKISIFSFFFFFFREAKHAQADMINELCNNWEVQQECVLMTSEWGVKIIQPRGECK